MNIYINLHTNNINVAIGKCIAVDVTGTALDDHQIRATIWTRFADVGYSQSFFVLRKSKFWWKVLSCQEQGRNNSTFCSAF